MKKIILSFLAAAALFSLHAQSAQKMTEIITRDEINYGDVSYFLSIQAGLCSDQVSEKDAFISLYKEGYFPENFDELSDTKMEGEAEEIISRKIRLNDLALLCTKAYGIKGGIFYRITKAPRYALRELKARQIVQNDADPASYVSGKTFLGILSGIEEYKSAAGVKKEASDE